MPSPLNLRIVQYTPGRVLIHGHRGARGVYPENSIAGFEYAIGIGVDAIELDVVITRDGTVVLSHDPLPNGDGGGLPTLDEVLQLAPGNQVVFNIEIKSYPGYPIFSAQVLEAIRRHRLEARVIVQSFDFPTLLAMKKLAPEIVRAALWEGEPRSLVEIAGEAETSIVAPEYTLLTAGEVQAAHAAGLQVIPWTVNHPRDWERLIAWGVDGIITDYPAALIQYHN